MSCTTSHHKASARQIEAFAAQSALTSPGQYAHAIDALPDDVVALLGVVRGLLVHCDYLDIYGLDTPETAVISRETLPLEGRLDRLHRQSAVPFSIPRPIEAREVGTCRDYAVMTCGLLRQKAIPARVRCGFARYFTPGRFEDHWLCEYWRADEERWARADSPASPHQPVRP